ncbi:permease [uncultured Clostridium sp.]|uniref:permease n=1 Tax=uncultured Clostridium sp. TaxID=59620 RepID=UPI0025EC8954|nr:permease [uncultured Clostridium sp.]
MLVMTKYLFIVLLCFAIGDFFGVFTKAKISSVFIIFMIFLGGFMSGIFPKDIIDQAGLTEFSRWSACFIIFSIGSQINLAQLKKEWRVVIMSLVAMAVALVGVLVIIPFIGRESALVSIPIVNGGINATQIMTEGALEKGLTTAAALGAFIYAIQKFVGTIPASYFGRQEGFLLVNEYREKKSQGIDLLKGLEDVSSESDDANGHKQTFFQKHKKYYTDYTCLAITACGGFLSYLVAAHTPGINYGIWALIFGCGANCLGLIPTRILNYGNSMGIVMMAMFADIIPALANVNLGNIAQIGFQTVLVFAAVLIFSVFCLRVLPLWKIVGSKNKAMGCAMAQLLGFPATQLIVNEVALAVSETEEEKNYVITKLTPAFVVSGFVSVTSLSIIIAGVLVNFL